ncbi:MAG: ATP-grasp domain-containing protein, partial [Bacteroidota bacterium]
PTQTNPDFSSLTAADIDVLVNEIAPRPHNSGHHTIEGCHCSQFEQFLRILTNKPLGNPALKQPAAMLNIVGPTTFSGSYKLEHQEYLNHRSDVFVHMYNKSESKPNRKLGHATILANTLEELLVNAEELKSKLTIIPS